MASQLAWMTSDDGDSDAVADGSELEHSLAYMNEHDRIMSEHNVRSDIAHQALRHFESDGVVDDIVSSDFRNGNQPVNLSALQRQANAAQIARDAQRDAALAIATYTYNGIARNEPSSSEPQTQLQVTRHQSLISDAHKHFELRKRMDAAHDNGSKQEFFESLNEFQEAGSGLNDPETHQQLVLARKQIFNVVDPRVQQMEDLESQQQAETAACIRKLQDQVMNYWKMTTDMPSLRHGSSESDQFVSKQALEHLQLGFLLWIQLLNLRSTSINEPEPSSSTNVPEISEVFEDDY